VQAHGREMKSYIKNKKRNVWSVPLSLLCRSGSYFKGKIAEQHRNCLRVCPAEWIPTGTELEAPVE